MKKTTQLFYLLFLSIIGFYSATVRAQNCTPISVVANPTAICSGSSSTLTASGSGGTTYSWSTGNTGAVIVVSPTVSTTYTVTGVKGNCSDTKTITVTVNNTPTVIVSASSNSICAGSAATLTATGAGSYTWSPAASLNANTGATVIASPSVTTVYTVTGSNNGCSNSRTVSVIPVANPTLNISSSDYSICAGSSTSLTASGAAMFSWDPGASLSATAGSMVIASPSVSTVYTVTGTANGCSSTASINITVNASPVISVNSGAICAGGSFTIVPSGANSYTIEGGSSVVSPTANASYTVVGESSEGCLSNVAVANVTVNASSVISVNSGAICAGGSFTIVPTGASSYTIEGGSSVVSPTANTSYTVVGESSEGCMSNVAVANVTVNASPVISVNSGAICAGGSFTIVPTGANSYTIEGGSSVVSPTANASYTVVGESSEGCMSNVAVANVTVNASPVISVNSGAICAGGSFTIVPTGASSYTIEGGASVVSPTANASYTVVGESSEGCMSNVAVANVTVNASPVISVNSGAICAGGSFTIVPTGASSYTIEGGSSVVSPTANASYTVVGESSEGCMSNIAVANVTVNAAPVISVNSGAICAGGSFTIVPTGASSYTIEGGSSVVSPTANASYTVVGESSEGCLSNVAVANVTVNASPVISVNSGAICAGGSFTIVPTGASSYTIEGGSSVVSPTANASYTVVGESSEGCMSNVAVANVTVNASPVISVNSGAICAGGSFTIVPTGANSYTIEGGTSVVSPTANASYTVVGESSEGCMSNVAVANVTVNASPVISVNSGAICAGGSFTIVPTGASSYTIEGGSSVVSPTANASYTVVGESTEGCMSNVAVANVTVNASPVISVNSGAICAGGSFTILPTGANSYTIEGGSSVVSPTANTSYTVVGESSAGCLSNVAVSNVTVNALPVVNAGGSFTVYHGYTPMQCAVITASVSGGTAPYQYLWSNNSTSHSITVCPTVTTVYTLSVTDDNGCRGVDQSTVIVHDITCDSTHVLLCFDNETICVSESDVLDLLDYGATLGPCGLVTGVSNTVKIKDNKSLHLFPNPNTGSFTLELCKDGMKGAAKIDVINALGQTVYSKVHQVGDGCVNEKIELGKELQAGLYIISVKIGHYNPVSRMIITK